MVLDVGNRQRGALPWRTPINYETAQAACSRWRLSAREKGQAEYADRLTEQAADFLDAAKAAELVAAQQQQQPQPKKK